MFMLFSLNAYSEDLDLPDIKVFCDCEKSKWIIEKIPDEIAKKLFEMHDNHEKDGALGETRTPMFR